MPCIHVCTKLELIEDVYCVGIETGAFIKKHKEKRPTAQSNQPSNNGHPQLPEQLRVVGIGASAGGLQALKQLLPEMPEDSNACFVVIVHLSPEHESHLADMLQPFTKLPVCQVKATTQLESDHIYVIPPGANIEADNGCLRLSDLESHRHQRAPIDRFFRSLAENHKERAVGILLTGTGSDGTAGLRHIREHGGLTLVQSPQEAEHEAMPRNAIAAGVVDLVLPIEQLAKQILEFDRTSPPYPKGDKDSAETADSEGTLQKIIAEISNRTGHNFANYKLSTIRRRIHRRMQLQLSKDLESYLQLLHENSDETELLFEDLLITVTEFFRDPEVFRTLATDILPDLFEKHADSNQIRVWSIGCSTGEEAYSLSMLLEEYTDNSSSNIPFQLFATDLHRPSLMQARKGHYPKAIEAQVSEERLKRFFQSENGVYKIDKRLRERIVFALHNILQDPPFSHLHLISCRNLLIYLRKEAQQQLTTLFHYALEEGGTLLLGSAESVDTDRFTCIDKQKGIYQRRRVPSQSLSHSNFPLGAIPQLYDKSPAGNVSYGLLHEQAVELYAPPSALIGPDGELMHYSAQAGRYLFLSGGTPSNNIFKLLPEPLRFELKSAMHITRSRSSDESRVCYRSRPVECLLNERKQLVVLRLQAIDQPDMNGYFLVMFDEIDPGSNEAPAASPTNEDPTLVELKRELAETKRRIDSISEEHDESLARAQIYTEELESTNEELRATMEELETSKEEIQNMNEALNVLNEDSVKKAEKLDRLSSELTNLINATHIATVFLDLDMQIRRFTPSMSDLFNIRESDTGRPLPDLTHRLKYEQLQEDFQRVVKTQDIVEREVECKKGRCYLVHLKGYGSSADQIDGVVVTFIDITERKEAEQRILKAKELAEKVIETISNPMLILSEDLRIQSANEAFYQFFDMQADAIKGKFVYKLGKGQWNIPQFRKLMKRIIPETSSLNNYEVEYPVSKNDHRFLLLNARQINHAKLILLSIEDRTDSRRAQQALEEGHSKMELLVRARTNELLQQSTRLQHLVHELSTAEQRERKRMAAVLHDDLQQLLIATKMQLEMTRSDLTGAAEIKALSRAVQHLDESIETTYALVRQTNPQVLYEQGLISALKSLCREMARRHSLSVCLHTEEAEPEISDDLKTLLYDSVRELLFNIVKHARVDNASLNIQYDSKQISVTISDRGVGFDTESKANDSEKSAFGLYSVGDRIQALGGKWKLDSSPGEGTEVHLQIPLGKSKMGDLALSPAQPSVPKNLVEGGVDPIRIIVVDDHALVRDGVISLFRRDPRIGIAGAAKDGVEAIQMVEEHRPDVVLMDVKMPVMNGIDATREILRRWPTTQVIGLSMQDAEGEEARAIANAGAIAFLRKSDDSDKMIATILSLFGQVP